MEHITIRFWWENAEKSGKAVYSDMGELSKVTGIPREELLVLFNTEVESLGEWWEVIGNPLHKTQRQFAEKLGMPRTSLGDYIRGGMPEYQEYWDALYAYTALPQFQLASEQASVQDSDNASPASLAALTVLSEALLRELEIVDGLVLTEEERLALNSIIKRVLERLTVLTDNLALEKEFAEVFENLEVLESE